MLAGYTAMLTFAFFLCRPLIDTYVQSYLQDAGKDIILPVFKTLGWLDYNGLLQLLFLLRLRSCCRCMHRCWRWFLYKSCSNESHVKQDPKASYLRNWSSLGLPQWCHVFQRLEHWLVCNARLLLGCLWCRGWRGRRWPWSCRWCLLLHLCQALEANLVFMCEWVHGSSALPKAGYFISIRHWLIVIIHDS